MIKMISDLIQKIKTFLKDNRQDLFLAATVFLVGLGSFGLGRLSAIWPEKEPITIENVESGMWNVDDSKTTKNESAKLPSTFNPLPSTQGSFVASRNGSSYHLPTCSGAKQIKEENKVWFATAEEARKAGYKPAGNCPGL